jgi:Protein of unknown function (DUF2730)
MSPSWLDWFRTAYPVVISLISLSGVCATLWLGTRFAAKGDHAQLAARVTSLETRFAVLEEQCETSPTRGELRDEIGSLAERVSAMEASIAGFAKQLETTNSYLHSLINSGLAQSRARTRGEPIEV